MKGLILDLRNNPGGLLDQAVGVSDLFLEGGEIVSPARPRSARRRALQRPHRRHHRRHADGGADQLGLGLGRPRSSPAPCRTASAPSWSALTSFGKGSVQTVIPLRGGMDGALKLTTARYFTPSGRSIQKTGIEPDLEVAADPRGGPDHRQPRLPVLGSLRSSNALNADEGKVRRGAHEPAEAPPEAFDEKKDFQMARAKDVLKFGSVAATPKLPKPTARLAEDRGPGQGRRGEAASDHPEVAGRRLPSWETAARMPGRSRSSRAAAAGSCIRNTDVFGDVDGAADVRPIRPSPPPRPRTGFTIKQYEELQPRAMIEHDGVKMVFLTPSEMTLWRVRTIRTKEPTPWNGWPASRPATFCTGLRRQRRR